MRLSLPSWLSVPGAVWWRDRWGALRGKVPGKPSQVIDEGNVVADAVILAAGRITDTLASINRGVERRNGDGEWEPVPGHPVTALLDDPQAESDRWLWADRVFGPLVTRGTGAAVVYRIRDIPASLRPCRVSRIARDGSANVTTLERFPERINGVAPEDLLIVQGSGFDGGESLDPMQTIRERLNLSARAWRQLSNVVDARYDVIEQDRRLGRRGGAADAGAVRRQVAEAGVGSPVVLSPGFRYRTGGGMRAGDVGMLPILDAVTLVVARVFKTPPAVLFESGPRGLLDVQEGEALMWQGAISPLDRRINAACTRRLLNADERGAGLRVRSRMALLRGLTPFPRTVKELVVDGLMRQNEGRSLIGLPPDENGNTLYPPRGSGAPPQTGGEGG